MKSVLKHLVIISLVISFFAHAKQNCSDLDNEVWANQQCTKIETYKSNTLSSSPSLAIVLHGDAHQWPPSSHYRIAQKLSQLQDNVIAVGMLRPGYSDDWGRTSDGERGDTVGDNYDDARVIQIAEAITNLKNHHKAQKVVVLGHYGGATILGRLIAMYPNLVDHAVMVSCNCNINAWRKALYERTQEDIFKDKLLVTSPMDLAHKVSDSTAVSLIVGKNDKKTGPVYSREYYNVLKNLSKNVSLNVVDGNHYIFSHQAVVNTASKALVR
ncbi:alpha/beta fold hydrolase (plasmid) [Pseudoalteromonas sp. T1lg65]|uniref:alpha/beta fold hydrolase n=1 Tax=Pseudoalteromonas sp. T1lg65 TaxID=2077101 RepID=UPI003F7AA1E2